MKELPLILICIINVESAGRDNALGDYRNGIPEAYGCLQIHQCVLDDIERIYGLKYDHNEMFYRDKAVEVFRLYMDHYASEERLGYEPDPETIARIWNGGPYGHRKRATENYWHKVKQEWRKQVHERNRQAVPEGCN